jgi:hypothetical protein
MEHDVSLGADQPDSACSGRSRDALRVYLGLF